MSSWRQWVQSHLQGMAKKNQLRHLRTFPDESSEFVSFGHNDYLGLSRHPEVRRAVAEIARRSGMGRRSAALVTGYSPHHEALEGELALLKTTETALLFPTGWAANTGVLTALASDDLTIFSDALNHASIIDGCRLARHLGAEVKVFRHRDLNHLETLLRESTRTRRLIITDSLFGMDGEIAPLKGLVELKNRYGAWLALDEAHATLVLGSHGAGAAEAAGVQDQIEISIGTLSKAFGAQGGFVASTFQLKNYLLNRARPFVFSTALPLPVVVAAQTALDQAKDGSLRSLLRDRINCLAKTLQTKGRFSPIFPLVLGSEERALNASAFLQGEGFFIPAIRPPTVPRGSSRLRISLAATHSWEDLDRLIQVLTSGVLPSQDENLKERL